LLDSWDAIADPVAHEIDNVYRESAATARTQLEAADRVQLKVINSAARDFSRARAAEMVGKKWVDGKLVENPNAKWAITDTTREVLRNTVKQAFEEGWTQVDLADRIQESGIFGEARAEMIAKTEMARAQVEGALWTAREVGVIAKQAELSGDHDHDDECDEAVADGVIAIDDEFSVGGNGPPFHPNCNCALVFFTAADPEAAEFVKEE
jgi:hypothetical protein